MQSSPDGRRIVTEDHEGLRLWETATGEPLTLRQSQPTSIGIGYRAQGLQAFFSPDGQSVLHRSATRDVLCWHFPTPPTSAPAWLPELLESLAAISVTQGEALAPVPPANWLALREKLRTLPGDDFYAQWARRFGREAQEERRSARRCDGENRGRSSRRAFFFEISCQDVIATGE